MKSRILLASALLLAGCQITNTVEEQASTNKNETLTQTQVTGKSVLDVDDKPIIKEEKRLTPQEQDDVWQRLSMQITTDIPNNKQVQDYRNWYLKHPAHLNTVSKRAEPFLYYITEEVEKRGFPLELALLPIVESSFDQFAYSHGRAAGLWQITPPTGRSFGLEQNWWYDGRRDVVESTRAALDLLEYLNRKFDGNWQHALAAYNTGEGRVFRAIRKNKAAGKPTDFWSLDLPKETSGYVPKLYAVADVIRNQKAYGIEIPNIANKPAVKLVEPGIQMDLAMAAQYASMKLSELQSLNPAYNQWATAPDGPNHLLLPTNKVDTFNIQLANSGHQGMNVIRYQVKPGDSLSVLAAKHKTTVKQIQRANKITGTSIRTGKHILIPVAMKDSDGFPSAYQAQQVRSQKSHGSGYRTVYHIKSGDSLWTIARSQKVTIDQLTKWNGLSKNQSLHIGQKLNIWKTSGNGGVIRTVYYEIRQGDNLSKIAQRYKVKVSDVVKWNNISSSKYLKPGQKLKLYIDVTKVSV
ncbi:LysM peptidoglycan-binding domain-containing protein [Photobacterium sp.]|uniref:lytic transglycosylase n=1 Tax=Photobacterium sp. TaxID=660 RepID=UPI00299DD9F1|nr:LysM peptidoglycan-binding domain-containing protein [Photobacterium sp.]MDX1304408.1 LysM peptidoglycan-binding domain-containing protein [Photobacterium sp.]